MATARRIPVDLDDIGKGDYITPDMLAPAFQPHKPGSKEWAFKLMSAQSAVAMVLTDRYGADVTVVTSNDGLRVLTDWESSEYNARQCDKGLALMRRANRRMLGVVTSGFNEEQKREHERRQLRSAFTLQGAIGARQKLMSDGKLGVVGKIELAS